MTDQRRLLVTSALPYANGPIHLGHILEHTQTDIFVRFQRMRNHECVYVCADDVHGTAVMLNAEAAGQDPLDYALAITEAHKVDFAAFDISHNWYDTTHSSENRALATSIYERLRASGNIKKSDVAQLFDLRKGSSWQTGLSLASAPSATPATNMATTVMPAARLTRQRT